MTDLKKLKAGKLPLDLLDSLLSGIEINDPRVVLGPKVGEDAALIDFGAGYRQHLAGLLRQVPEQRMADHSGVARDPDPFAIE